MSKIKHTKTTHNKDEYQERLVVLGLPDEDGSKKQSTSQIQLHKINNIVYSDIKNTCMCGQNCTSINTVHF